MIGNYFSRGRDFIKTQPLMVNYGIDGILIMGGLSIAANNNNLFAQRLGATDLQLTLLQFFPNVLIFLLLIPAGLFTDSLKNKRRMMSASLLFSGIFFAMVSLAPFVPTHTVYFFLVFLALALVSTNWLYNLAWQAFFPEAVKEENRNTILTFRARMTMIVALIVPLAVGAILTAIPDYANKIRAHQIFYVLAAILLIVNAFYLKRIKSVTPIAPKKVSFAELKTAAKSLTKNKPFIIFSLVILFAHMSWHIDWTLYFIGQVNYLHMNELMLNIAPVLGMVAQLSTLKFWSKFNAKRGMEIPIAFGIFGMAIHGFAIIVGTSLPSPFNFIVFWVFHFIAQLSFSAVVLNLFQCLLKVVDSEYRSFSISIYTCLITLSNAIFPRVGVLTYQALGGNLNAIRYTFVIVFAVRVAAGVLWMFWIKYNKHVVQQAV